MSKKNGWKIEESVAWLFSNYYLLLRIVLQEEFGAIVLWKLQILDVYFLEVGAI